MIPTAKRTAAQLWTIAWSKPSLALAGNIGQKAVTLITNIVLARLLGAEGYGAVALGLTFFLVVQAFATLGLTEGMVRFGAATLAKGDHQNFSRIFTSSNIFALASNCIVCIVIILLAEPIANFFDAGEGFAELLQILMLAVPFFTIIMMMASYRQAHQMILGQQAILLARVSLTLILCLTFVFIPAEPVQYAWVVLIAHMGLAAGLMMPSLKRIRHFPRLLARDEAKQLLSFSLVILSTHASWLIWSNLDRVMLARLGTLSDVGVYSVVSALAINIQLGVVAMGGLVMPVCAAAHTRGDRAQVIDAYGWYSLIGVFAAGLLGVSLLLEAPGILGLFGPEFSNYGWALSLLVVGQFLSAFPGPLGKLLIVIGHQNSVMIGSIAQVALNIVLNLLLIPEYGVNGAAAATLVALALPRLVYSLYIHRRLGFWTPDRYAFLAALVIGLAAIAADQLGALMPLRVLGINISDYIWLSVLAGPPAALLILHRRRKRIPEATEHSFPGTTDSVAHPPESRPE